MEAGGGGGADSRTQTPRLAAGLGFSNGIVSNTLPRSPSYGNGMPTPRPQNDSTDVGHNDLASASDTLALAKRILSSSTSSSSFSSAGWSDDYDSNHSRTPSASSSTFSPTYLAAAAGSDGPEYVPEAGPSRSSPPPLPKRSSSRISSQRKMMAVQEEEQERNTDRDGNNSDVDQYAENRTFMPPSRHKHGSSNPSLEKETLAKLVGMYESLTSEMSTVLSRQAELETNLKIARSNLALAENHAEALEDTLKRNSQSRLSNGGSTPLNGYSPSLPPVPTLSGGASPNLSSSSTTLRSQSRSPNPQQQGAFGQNHQQQDATSSGNDTEAATSLPSPRIGSFWKRRPNLNTTSYPNLAAMAGQQPSAVDGYDPSTGKRSSSSLGIHGGGAAAGRAGSSGRPSFENNASEDEGGNATITRKQSFGMLRGSGSNASTGSSTERAQAATIKSLQDQLVQSKQAYTVLQTEYNTLQQNHSNISAKYASLQEEIENLSVSLFEEANTMVAEERKVNSFLNEQLDKAKLEAEDLQRQIDGLQATLAATKERMTSPTPMPPPLLHRNSSLSKSQQSHRRRTSTSSSALSHPSRNRRRSSIAALDALETFVASSPRRASRDLAAAAAAVRSLGQSHSSDLHPLPHSASTGSFSRSQLSMSHPAQSLSISSISAPTTATLPPSNPSQTSVSPAYMNTSHDESNAPPVDQYAITKPTSQVMRKDSSDASDEQALNSATSLRSRWFSFGSRRRPKLEAPANAASQGLSSPVPSSSPMSTSPIDGSSAPTTIEEEKEPISKNPPRSPDRNQKHNRLNSSFSPEMFKAGIPESSREGLGRYRISPGTNLSSNVQHLVSSSARPSHTRTQSTSSSKNASHSRPTSPYSPAGTDTSGRSAGLNRSLSAFSSPAGRRPGTGPRELILLSGGSATSSPRSHTASPLRELGLSKQQQQHQHTKRPSPTSRTSPNTTDDTGIPRSPSVPRYMPVAELHSILDQITADDLQPSFTRLTATGGFGDVNPDDRLPLPFSTLSQSQSPSQQAELALPQSSRPGSSLRTHKKSSWSVSSNRSRTSVHGDSRPSSRLSERENASDVADYDQTTLRRPVSPTAALPLSITKAAHPRLAPLITSASQENGRQANGVDGSGLQMGAREPSSPMPFALPTPPMFKRFPRDAGYRAPLYSPSRSDAITRQRSGSSSTSGFATSSDLQRSGSMASNASFSHMFDPKKFSLQRQNSNMSVGAGSVVGDLDELMKSIDAISESLGFEGDSIDGGHLQPDRRERLLSSP